MWRFNTKIIWLVSLGLLLTACSTATPTDTVAPASVQTAPQAGDKAPEFTLADSVGNRVDLAAVVTEHKSTVLVFYLSNT